MSKPSKPAPSALALVSETQICITDANLPNLKKVVISEINAVDRLHADAALRAILAGFGLHRVKSCVPHGTFMPWIKKELGATRYRSANYYMRLAVAFLESAHVTKPEVLALPVETGSLAIAADHDAAAAKFLAKAKKFVGEMSLNELLDEHGIKDQAKLGGARAKGGAVALEDLDAEQMYLFSRDEIGGGLLSLENLLVKENRLQHLIGHPEEIRGVVESLRALADKVEKAAKPLFDAPAPKA